MTVLSRAGRIAPYWLQRLQTYHISRNLFQIRTVSTPSSSKEKECSRIKTRNVGIMAHIDAGKTTTTERMLYYSGRIRAPGEVHHGDTVTDFLPQERERGITIQSAVVGFEWRDSHINIIDTPGHVDFTFEVERSLRVADSAVAILDASAGVEAQTLTVWRQASSYNLPRLIFLNKMDKGSSSYQDCLNDIISKLKSTPVLLQLPIYSSDNAVGSGSGFSGLIDLINLKRLTFQQGSKGAEYILDDVSQDKEYVTARCELVEQIADLENGLASKVIESESIENISAGEIKSAIKRMTLLNTGVPVLLGSSYKNIGVQPLLDGIVEYLPSSDEVKTKDPVISSYGNELCAFAFKTIHDRQLGALTFTRIFGGTLTSGQKVYNVTREKTEKIYKTYLPFANEYKEVSQLNNGDVGVISGLKETVTGDTLTSSASVAGAVERKLDKKVAEPQRNFRQKACLSGVSIPEPVFFCSVEPASLHQQKGLDIALECLKREDPSLRVHVDPDTSQTVMAGMGELHLEILHDRLKSEFKVDCDLGKVMVAYKETITEPIANSITFERKLADHNHSVVIELELRPKKKVSDSGSCPQSLVRKGIGREIAEKLHTLTERQLRNITNGVEAALRMGPKLAFPVIDVEVFLNNFIVGRGTSETIIEAAAAHCVREALRNACVVLLEPIVTLEITVDERFQHIVTEDLNRRRFLLESIDFKHGNKVVTGTAPLSELMGYSTVLRTISSGLGTYSMQFSHHSRVSNGIDEDKIIREVRGF